MKSSCRLFAVAVACMVGVTAGCKKTYESPQEFIEKFGQELYAERYGKAMEWMGYERLVLSDAQVGIDQYRGEYVSATATIVPKTGLTYHKRVPVLEGAWRMCNFNTPYELSRYAGEHMYQAICRKVEDVRRNMPQPLVYEAANVDMEPQLAPACVIRVYRAKDGSGVYHPVSGGGQDALAFYDSENKYRMSSLQRFNSDVGGVVSSDMIKRFNGIEAGSPEAAEAAEVYSNAIVRANAAFVRAREACAEVGSLDQKIRDEYTWVTRKVNAVAQKLNAEVREAESTGYKMKNEYDAAIRKCAVSINAASRNRERAAKHRDAAQSALEKQQAQIAQSEGRKNIGQSVIDRMKKQAAKYADQIEQANADEQAASEESIRLEGELASLKEKAEASAKKCEKDIADAKARRNDGIERAEAMAKAEHAELLKKAHAAAEAAADEIWTALNGINANARNAEKTDAKRNADKPGAAERGGAAASKAVIDAVKAGRLLFHTITKASLEREALGIIDVWPHLAEEDGLSDDSDDIAGKVFKTSTAYFAELLDLKRHQTADWQPYVKGLKDVSLIDLSGTNEKGHCDWIVLAGVTGGMPDDIPVLISANADYSRLPFTAQTWKLSNDTIPIGKAAGRTGIPWGDDFVVVVRKGGKAEAIKAADFNARTLLGKGGVMQFNASVLQGNKMPCYLDVK